MGYRAGAGSNRDGPIALETADERNVRSVITKKGCRTRTTPSGPPVGGPQTGVQYSEATLAAPLPSNALAGTAPLLPEERVMKPIMLTGVMLGLCIAAAPIAAHAGPRQDRHQVRQDRREVRLDQREVRSDRKEVRQDRRDGDRRELRQDRRETRQDQRGLQGDRRDLRQDRRDLRHDRQN